MVRSKKARLGVTIITLLLMVGYLVFFETGVVASSETRDFLYGDGTFEGANYNNWSTYSSNIDVSGAPLAVFSQDTTTGAGGTTQSAKVAFTRSGGGISAQDTGWYEYSFATPIGYTSTTLSFSYKATFTNTLTISWEVLSSTATVASGTVANNTAWTSSGNINVTGLSANTTYRLRLKAYMAPSSGATTSVWFDQATLTVAWNDTLGPSFTKIIPGTGVYVQGIAGSPATLSTNVVDPAGVKSVKWEYSPKGLNTWTVINTDSHVTSSGGAYSITWNTSALTDQQYDVRLTATDNSASSNVSTSIVTYNVDSHGPSLSSFSPASSSLLSGYSQALSVAATDFAGVKSVTWEYWDAVNTPNEWVPIETTKTATTGSTFSVTWHTTNMTDGSYTVRVKAVDKSPAALLTTSSTLTYVVNNLAPVLMNELPTPGSALRGTPTLSVDLPNPNHDANPVSSVKWEYSANNGATWTTIGTDTTSSGANNTYSVSWNTTGLPDGSYLVKVSAVDSTSVPKTGAYQMTYAIDNTAPTLNRVDVITQNLATVVFNDANMNSSSATNPAYYSVYETSTPANTLSVTQVVAKVDGTGVKLTMAEQKPGVGYTVQVNTAVTDRAGNPLSGGNTKTFTGVSLSKGNPHGGYLTTGDWCTSCHNTHSSSGSKLTTQTKEKLVCYTCHDDSGLSVYDIRAEFGVIDAPGGAVSHHPVPEDQQKCTTCHDPHLAITTIPKLIKITDGSNHTYNSGNNTCWACHGNPATHGTNVAVPGDPSNTALNDHEIYYNTSLGLDGSKQGAHSDISKPLLAPLSGAQISCTVCHAEHGSEHDKLLKSTVNNTVVDGDDNSLCFGCHTNPQGSFLGKAVWDDTTYSAHSRTDSGAIFPGGSGTYGPDRYTDLVIRAADRGKCVNCHNLHGTPNGKALVERFTVPAYNDTNALTNYALCFRCHGAGGVANKDIKQYFTSTYSGSGTFGGTMGHFIKSTSRYKDDSGTNFLAQGWKIPCFDCHNTHGSTGENRFLLRGDIGTVDGKTSLSHLFKGTNASGRDFCTQCHHTYNDTGVDHSYRSSTIPKLPSTNIQHSSDTAVNPNPLECNYCHGGGNLVKGAHSPNTGRSEGGLECDLCHTNLAAKMGKTSTLTRHYMSDFDADQVPSKFDASALGLDSTTCLASCHTDHDYFNSDPVGSKRFLRTSGGNTSTTPTGMAPVTATEAE